MAVKQTETEMNRNTFSSENINSMSSNYYSILHKPELDWKKNLHKCVSKNRINQWPLQSKSVYIPAVQTFHSAVTFTSDYIGFHLCFENHLYWLLHLLLSSSVPIGRMKTAVPSSHSILMFIGFHPRDENHQSVDGKIVNHHFSSIAV